MQRNVRAPNAVTLHRGNIQMSPNASAVPEPPSLPHEKLEITASAVVYSLLALAIIVGNGLVIAAYRYNPRLQTLTNTFLAWLALSDLLVGLVAVPLWIYISWCYQFQSCDYGNGLLMFYGTVDVFTGCTSVLQLAAIGLERFVAITRPFSHRSYPVHVYRGMITAAWVFSFVIAGLYPLQIIYGWMSAYSILISTTCYALPTVVILVVYLAIFRSVKNGSKRRIYPNMTNESVRKRQQSERRIAVTIAVITGLFLVAWTPFYVLNLMAQFCPLCLPPQPGIKRLVRFVKWMHYSNSVVNPCIYTYRSGEMRKTFVHLLRACLCCNRNNSVDAKSSSRTQGVGVGRSPRAVSPCGPRVAETNDGANQGNAAGETLRVPPDGTLV